MIGGLLQKGKIEEFEFWGKLGVDFLMLGVAYDFFLDDKAVSKVLNLRDKSGMNLLVHPRPDGKFMQSPSNPEAHDLLFESLARIQDLVRHQGLIDKVIMHLPTCSISVGDYERFTEAEAISNSRRFYKRLKEINGLTFVLENGYPPGIGWEELGYKTDHFRLFDFPENCEFCLDTGHLNLSELTVDDILSLPFDITCFHLHSNNGLADQHVPITRKNFKDWKQIEGLLSKEKYIIMEVKNGLESVPEMLEHLRHNEIMS